MGDAARVGGWVRVTVASGDRRADLAVPGAVPVAEVLPELLSVVGGLETAALAEGHRLLTPDGRTVEPGLGLDAQGIEDGALLVLVGAADVPPPRRYDDVVEAVADAVERDRLVWPTDAARYGGLAVAVLAGAVAAAGLAASRDSPAAGGVAASAWLVLVAVAAGHSRVRRDGVTAAAVAWVGVAHAAAAGLVLVPVGGPLGSAWTAAGAGTLLGGLSGVLVLRAGRSMVAPAAAAGSVMLGVGVLDAGAGLPPATVGATALVLAVLVDGVLPAAAVAASGAHVEPLRSVADLTGPPLEVDAVRVGDQVRRARGGLVAATAAVGAVLLVAAPLAATRGVAGGALATAACLVVLLRGRRFRDGRLLLASTAAGTLGLLAVAATLLWSHPAGRPFLAAGLVVLVAPWLLPGRASAPRGALRSWLGDVAEATCLLALLPLLVLATGALTLVGG